MNREENIVLRLGTEDEAISWFSPGRRGEGDAHEVQHLVGGQPVKVLVPGSAVLTRRVAVPSLKKGKQVQAVPYLLEEQLACDVEAQHFALGKRDSEGSLPVAVVEKSCMDRWHERLSTAGLKPRRLLPDYLAIPWQAGQWSLLIEDKAALLRTGQSEGGSLPVEALEPLVNQALALAGEELPQRLVVYDARAEGAGDPGIAAEGLEVEYLACPDPLKLMAETLTGDIPLNLLQGDYGYSEAIGRYWRPWRAAAVLAGCWLLLEGGMAVERLAALGSEEERLYRQVEQLYSETFPGGRMVNPRVQMERALTELGQGGGSGLSRLLSGVAPALGQLPGLELRGLRYRQASLELELKLADLPSLDKLKAAIEAAGFSATIDSANARGDEVEGRISVKEMPA